MNTLYLACLFGGALSTVLFAAAGAVGGHHAGARGHPVSHGHASHAGQGSHLGHGSHTGQSTHAGHGTNLGHPSHASQGTHHASTGVRSGHSPQSGQHTAGQHPSAVSHAWGVASWAVSWLSPLTVAAAALWFGGAGLAAEQVAPGFALLPAVVAALVGAALVRAGMATLIRASTPPLAATPEGAIATVNAAIGATSVGEVVFTLEGLARSSPARSVDSQPIPRGETVVIVGRDKGIAWVTPLDPLGSQVGEDQTTPTHASQLPIGPTTIRQEKNE